MKRTIRRSCGAAVVGVAGLALTATPAAAETYDATCELVGVELPFPGVEITATSPTDAVTAGTSFTLTDLVLVIPIGSDGEDGAASLTLLGQTVDLGSTVSAGGALTWGPVDVELTAPGQEGEVPIAPEGMSLSQESIPVPAECTFSSDTPFASITVEAGPDDPGGGNGSGGPGGSDGPGSPGDSGGAGGRGDSAAPRTAPPAPSIPGEPNQTG